MNKNTRAKSPEEKKRLNEGEFLTELIAAYKKWKGKGEAEYAEAYKVLINKFTQLSDTE